MNLRYLFGAVMAVVLASSVAPEARAATRLPTPGQMVAQHREATASRKEFEQFVDERPRLQEFRKDAMRGESVGQQRLIGRLYTAAGTAGAALVVKATMAAGAVALVDTTLEPKVMGASAAVLLLRGWRQHIKTAQSIREANASTIAEAGKIAKEDPTYRVPQGKVRQWFKANVIRSKEVHTLEEVEKVKVKKDKAEKKAEKAAKVDVEAPSSPPTPPGEEPQAGSK